jgi:hypothetical protein
MKLLCSKLPSVDAEWRARVSAADARKERLVYVARVRVVNLVL